MTDSDGQRDLIPEVDPEEVTEDESFANNYAMAIALGLPFGLIFGLLVLDDITWGLIIGMGLAPIIAMLMTRFKSDD